jgi:pre-mRNA-processing factor SLU7
VLFFPSKLQIEDDAAPSSDDEDEDKYVDKMRMVGTKVDAAERYTVRNLRIREDTAKYLRNLDPNSAHYDPKTRSMRKNPYESTGKTEEEVEFAGDNFVRISGDTVNHAQSQLFAWEAGAKGLDVHALAEPTKLEALKKEYKTKKTEFKGEAKRSILDKYGGVEHLEAPPRELIFSQTEDYVEYTRHGKIIKGEEDPVVRSRYEEDVHPGNHSAIFGSYFTEGKWGFGCCHSFVKNSYCTGAAGKEAGENTLTLPPPTRKVEEKEDDVEKEKEEKKEEKKEKKKDQDGDDEKDKSSDSSEDEEAKAESVQKMKEKEEKQQKKRDKKRRKKDKKKKKKKRKRKDSSSESSSSSSDDSDFESKVAKAMKKQTEQEKKADSLLATDERKRTYNSLGGGAEDNKTMTDVEMEAYYRKRQRVEDPMAQFLDK